MSEKTGAERYLASRLDDPAYREAYERARHRLGQVDGVIRALDERRADLNLSKAELARRAGIAPEVLRRLFSAERPNPTLHTLAAIAEALGLDLAPTPKAEPPVAPSASIRTRSGGPRTQRHTA